MTDEIDISVFVDETGNIISSDSQHYGMGFVFLPTANIEAVENILSMASLNDIHIKTLPHSEKIDVSKKIGLLGLHTSGLRGGAVIRKNPGHARDFTKDYLESSILESPELAIMAIAQNSKLAKAGNRIIEIEEIFPNIIKNSRLMEFGVLISRYPIFRIIQAYGQYKKINVKVKLSVVGDKTDYEKKLKFSLPDLEKSMHEFLKRLYDESILKKDPFDFLTFEIETHEKSSGLFGLTDFFGAIGHHLKREVDDPAYTIGSSMYLSVENLFPEGPLLAHQEIKRGVFLLN